MPSDWLFKAANRFHRAGLKVTRGRLGWRGFGMPVIELITTGRRSGEPRTVMLTCPYQDGDTIVLVASRGGDDRPPAWLLNVAAEPRVEVGTKAGRRPMRAHVATPEERSRLWPLVTQHQPRYAAYQRRTTREIALVLLEPADGLTRSQV